MKVEGKVVEIGFQCIVGCVEEVCENADQSRET